MRLRKKITIGLLSLVGVFLTWQYVLAVGYDNNPTFNTNNGTGFNDVISGVFIQPDGKIFVAGSFTSFDGHTNFHGVGRLNSNGTYDSTFGSTTGLTGSGYGPGNSAGAVLYSSTGKTYVCGNFTHYNGVQKNFIVSLNDDGTINSSFASGSGLANIGCRRIVEDLNNKLIIVGDFISYNGTSVSAIARIGQDGTLDTTFNSGGAGFSSFGVNDVEVLPDGKYLVASPQTLSYNGVSTGGLIRLNSDGTRDTSFNNGGSGFAGGGVTEIVRQSDGKLLIGGYFTSYNGTTANRIIRLNADGTIDNTFVTNIGTGLDGGVNYYDIAIQADDKIILGGAFTAFDGHTANRIVRINSDGTYDNTFGVGTGFNNSVQGIVIDTDNSIVITGSFTTYNGISANRIVRLQTSDATAPIITEVTPITNPTYDQTPDYVLNTDEAGTAIFGGSCNETTNRHVNVGDNTITLELLPQGTYSDCTVSVFDDFVNESNTLNIPTFEIIDQTAPVLTEVTPVPQPTLDTTPNYTFNTNEVGTLTYGGSCSSATTSATKGNNTITFSTLSVGLHSDCTITLTDSASNATVLNITSFTVSDPSSFTITNIETLAVSNAHIIITYTTSYPSDTYIEWGETNSYELGSYGDSSLVTNHTVIITNLNADTTYHYRITAQEQYGFTKDSGDLTFESLPLNGVKLDYVPNGPVYTSAIDSDGNLYLGGYFSQVGLSMPNFGVTYATSGLVSLNTPILDDDPRVVVSDGSSGWFVGGSFYLVNGSPRPGLIHILSDGSLDTAWNAGLPQYSYIYDLLVADNKLYVAGNFTSVNTNTTPATRNRLAAFDLTNGTVDATWNPSVNNEVHSITTDGSKIYAAGAFTSVNTETTPVSRNKMAAFNMTDGTVDSSWNPSPNNFVLDMTIDGSKLYAAGVFTSVNTNTTPVTRNRLAAFDLTNGTVDATWNPSLNGQANSLKIYNSKLYVGGSFTSVNTNTTPATRNRLAAFDLTNGTVDATWNPSVNSDVNWIDISNDLLYAAGYFSLVNTATTTDNNHAYFASFNLTDGAVNVDWDPNVDSAGLRVFNFGNNVFIAGQFDAINNVSRNNVYAIDNNGNLLDWDPDVDSDVISMALSPDEQTIYLGGYFNIVNQGTTPVNRYELASFDTTNGTVTNFDPDINGDALAIVVSPDGNTVYVGGYFDTVNQNTTPVARNYLAAFDADTGLVTSFNPDPDGQVGEYYGSDGLKLNSDGTILYATGWFQNVNNNTIPVARNYAAAFDTTTGIVTNWNPSLDSGGSSIEISSDGDTIFIGGYFNQVNIANTPVNRNYLAAFDSNTGIVLNDFDPDLDYTPYSLQISKDGLNIYAAGDFWYVNQNIISDVAPQYFADFRISDGVAEKIFPIFDSTIYTLSLSVDGTNLYAGGDQWGLLDYLLYTPYVTKFTVDVTDLISPVISEVTPVTSPTTDTTPDYIFTTSEAGTITYGGACSSVTTSASVGSNTITFNTLSVGTYSNCTITVTDASSNVSNVLNVSAFTINSSGGVAVPPPPVVSNTNTQSNTNTETQTNTNTENTNTNTETKTEAKKTTNNTDTNTNTENTIPETNTESNNIQDSSNESSTSSDFSSGEASASDSSPESSGSSFGSSVSNFVNVLGESISNILPQGAKVAVENIKKSTAKARQQTKEIIETKAGDAVVKTVTTVGAAAGVTSAVVSTIFVSPISMGEMVMIPFRLWSLFLGFLGIRRKNKPWGTVYDSVTKQPLDPAYVTLMDAETGEEVSSMITDLDGRYGFIVKPGVYTLVASKTNYAFPSKNLLGKMGDELYSQLYFGDKIFIEKEGDVIDKNIPLDPQNFDWNEFAKKDQNLNKYFKKKDLILARISRIVFPVGFVVAFIALIVAPHPYNYGIAGLYVATLISKKTIFKKKPKLKIKDVAGLPVAFSIIRFSTNLGQEVAHKVADIHGEVFCLLTDGQYKVSVESKNPDGSYTKVLDNKWIEVRGGYYAGEIMV